jgi:CHASE3 domain sensor protein
MNINKLLRQFPSDSIKAKVILTCCLVILIMLGTSLTAYVQVSKLKESELRETFRTLQKQVLEIKLSSHEFIFKDRNNIDFFSTGKSEYLNHYAEALNQYKHYSKNIKTQLNAAGFTDTQELEQLDEKVDEYHTIFKDIESRIKERGIENHGIIGDFDIALEKMNRFDYGSDNISLLRLKYFIQEYQLNGSANTIMQVSDETYRFSSLLEKYITDSQVVMVVYALSDYEANFKKLVKSDSALGLYSGKGLREKLFNKMSEIDNMWQLSKTDTQIAAMYTGFVNKTMISLAVGTLLLGFSIIKVRERDLRNDKRILEAKVVERTLEIHNKNLEINLQAEEIRDINQNLENLVKERTSQLERKNKALEEYAFITAHNLRAPVASILGLVNLTSGINLDDDGKMIMGHLKSSTEKLDTIVHSITEAIENAD